MENDIYHGKFRYAGGHPELAKSGSYWSNPQIKVTSEGLYYLHGKEIMLGIPVETIKSVRHETGAVGGFGGNNDQFIVVEFDRGDRKFEVRFKAEGMTQQKDAFNLNAALISIL